MQTITAVSYTHLDVYKRQPERQYKQLMKQYDDEQAELEAKMETMKKELSEEKDRDVYKRQSVRLLKQLRVFTR